MIGWHGYAPRETLAGGALLLVAGAAVLEIALSVPLGQVVYVLLAITALALLTPVWRSPGRLSRLVAPAAAVVALCALHLIPWNPRKVFLRDFDRVEVGMTLEEAALVLERYPRTDSAPGIQSAWPARGRSKLAAADSVVAYRPEVDGRFDSDFGVIFLAEGLVVATRFLPD